MKLHIEKESETERLIKEVEKTAKIVSAKGCLTDMEIEFERDLTSTELSSLNTVFQALGWRTKEAQ